MYLMLTNFGAILFNADKIQYYLVEDIALI